METKIFNLGKIPEVPGYENTNSYEACALDEFELDAINSSGADVAAYWYALGDFCYSGYGHIIFRVGGLWYTDCMNHDSSFGPTCDIRDFRSTMHNFAAFSTPREILSNASAECVAELAPLVELLEQKGFGSAEGF